MNNIAETKLTDLKQIEKKPMIKHLLHDIYVYIKSSATVNIETSEEQDLLDKLNEAKKDLDTANTNFEHAQDTDLVDYYIYNIKAAETRYQYLLKKIKGKDLKLNS